MTTERSNWTVDERLVRLVFACAASFIGIGVILTRNEDAVDWSLTSPTVLMFWLWAGVDRFPRAPLYLFGLSVPLTLNIIESEAEVSMFLLVLTVAILTSFETNRLAVRLLLGFTVVTTFVLGVTGAMSDFAWPNWLFGIAFAAGFGTLAYRHSGMIGELEHARGLVADQAAMHERRRIARDVHDLVGHSLSVVMLHVTGARHLVHKNPHEAERALEQAEAAGRESLAEIRRTVAMLRDEGDPSGAAVPSPDLSDVPTLVNDYLLGGVAIDMHVEGDVERVEGAAALAGYRIIQEALTNASRHTVDARVDVEITVGERNYDLLVRNSGGTTIDLGKGPGFGLVSMRERAKSVGGLLVAGPTPDGWTVEATLPLTSVEVAT